MVVGSILIIIAIIIFIIFILRRKKITKKSTSVGIFLCIFLLLIGAAYSLMTSYQVYDMKGISKERNNDTAGAIIEYEKAISKNSKDSFAYNQIINIYFQRGEYDKALEYSKKLIEIENNAIDYINKGNIEWELKLYDEGLKSYKKALELDATANLAYYGIGMIYFEKEEYNESFDYFQKYTKQVGEDIDAYYYMGTIKFIMNDFDSAMEYLNKVTDGKEYPNMYIAYFLKGEIFYSKEQYNKAIENYTESVKLNNSFADGYYNLARAYGKSGDKVNVLTYLKEAVKISDKFKQLAATDSAFNSFIQDPEFLAIIQ